MQNENTYNKKSYELAFENNSKKLVIMLILCV